MRRWKTASRYLVSQTAGRAAWLSTMLRGKDFLETSILGNGFSTPPRESVKAHKASVCLLQGGLLCLYSAQRLYGPPVLPAFFVDAGQLDTSRARCSRLNSSRLPCAHTS